MRQELELEKQIWQAKGNFTIDKVAQRPQATPGAASVSTALLAVRRRASSAVAGGHGRGGEAVILEADAGRIFR